MSIYHNHHIIPKHMGGSDDPSNLVQVTVEQHAQLHKQLWEEFGHWQDELAWKGLSQMIDKQELISKVISNTHKGKKVSDETRKKMSESQKGIKRPKSNEWKKEHSDRMLGEMNPMFGKSVIKSKKWKLSEDTKSKMKSKWKEREKITCCVCNKSMYKSNFIKWKHGENCGKQGNSN